MEQQIEITCDCGKKSYAENSALGKMFKCPHCGDTYQLPHAVAKIQGAHGDVEEGIDVLEEVEEEPPETAVKEVQKQERHEGGLEANLDKMGAVFLLAGILCCIIGGIVGGIGFLETITYGPPQFYIFICFLVLAVVGLIQGIALYLVFMAGAEMIRLLKKLNNLPYTGRISGRMRIHTTHNCSGCGKKVAARAEQCPRCKSVFVQSKN